MALKKSNKQRSLEQRAQQAQAIQDQRNSIVTRNLFFACVGVILLLVVFI